MVASTLLSSPTLAEQRLDQRLQHPDGASIQLQGVEPRADAILVRAEISNSGDHEIRLDVDHSFVLTDGTHGVHPLSPPTGNPDLRVPAHARLQAQLVFAGPPNPVAPRLTLSVNDGIGTTDNPFDDKPVFRAALPPLDVAGSARNDVVAIHPDGVALAVHAVTAVTSGIAVAITATNGGERPIQLNAADSLALTAGGRSASMQPAADNRTLSVPPGYRLDGSLFFPGISPAGDRVVLSLNDGVGTRDNPFDTKPALKLDLLVASGGAGAAATRLTAAPIARSVLSPIASVAAVTTPATPTPATPPAATSPAAVHLPSVSPSVVVPRPPLGPSPSASSPLPTPAPPQPSVPVAGPPAAGPASAASPLLAIRPATMALPQLKGALHAEETERGLRIVLPADALFGTGDPSATAIRSEADPMLEAVARLIAMSHPREVTVAGHTDGVGRDDANMSLSERRASAVGAWLEAHRIEIRGSRAPGPRFFETGYGRTRPAAPNYNPDGSENVSGREQNRRVEIFLRG